MRHCIRNLNLAVTGVFAMGEDDKPRSIEHGEDEIKGEADESEGLIVRSS